MLTYFNGKPAYKQNGEATRFLFYNADGACGSYLLFLKYRKSEHLSCFAVYWTHRSEATALVPVIKQVSRRFTESPINFGAYHIPRTIQFH